VAKLRWQLKWLKVGYFWLIWLTFVTVNLPWNIFREAVFRPLACSAPEQLPPSAPVSYAIDWGDYG